MLNLSKRFSQTGLAWLWVAVLVFALDQGTKWLAVHNLAVNQPVAVMPFFNWRLAYNAGAAFSLFSNLGGAQWYGLVFIAIAISVFILIWLYKLPKSRTMLNIALACVVGGAFGNLWDRVTAGVVTDFIEWYAGSYYWPAFNLADTAICIGALLIIMDSFFYRGE